MKTNWSILPLSELQSFSFQKCIVPSTLDGSLKPNELYECKDSSGNSYLCKVFTGDFSSGELCFLDKTVSKINGKCPISNIISEFNPVEYSSPPETISLEVTVTTDISERQRNLSLETCRHLLEPYHLLNGYSIVNDDMKFLGISRITVISESSGVFKISVDTKIKISNVKLETPKFFQAIQLGGVKASFDDLKSLFLNMSLCSKSQSALIVGPSGSGKTSLCHNFFLEYEMNVFAVQASELFQQYPGETENVLRGISRKAEDFVKIFNPTNPTVVFIENVDIICSEIATANSSRITSQFIALIDELHLSGLKILVIATTSNAESVNHSLKRNGRFSKEIVLRALDESGRREVLKICCEEKLGNISNEVLEAVVKKTPGYVGSDLNLLVEKVFKETIHLESFEIEKVFEHILNDFKPSSVHSSEVSIYKTTENFSSIGGMEFLKKSLEASILRGLNHSEQFQKFNLSIPKGVLLYGPPGCAKTTFAKCLATEANMTFIATSGAEVYSPYVGCAEKFISKIFDTARKNSPCLIFLDEIDTLIGKRSGSSSDVQTRILSTLLTEMDGIGLKMRSANLLSAENKILVVAATNRPDMIDDALMRPGRFDRLIHVPPPDFDSRHEIFKLYKRKMPFDDSVDLEVLANLTENFSGSDLCNLCNEVAMFAFMKKLEVTNITGNDFEEVLANTKSSLTTKQISWYYDFENKVL